MKMDDAPDWFKLINLDEKHFERSRYAGQSLSDKGKFRIKDTEILRQVAPNVYQAAADEVKAENEYLAQNGKRFQKLKLGRKLGSITMWDAALRPELMSDHKAQDRYFQDHPEMRAERPRL